MQITNDYLPLNPYVRSGEKHAKKWIVIHETGNKTKGATAKAHANYLKNLSKQRGTYLSWHYTVDATSIYHHIPDDEIAWHAGDGRSSSGGNMSGIGIEICVNSDGDFEKAFDNACWLCAQLLRKNGWTINNIKQHHDFSSYQKNCPETIRNTGRWSEFLNRVATYYNGTQNATTHIMYYNKCEQHYISLVDALKSIKVNSSFTYRAKIAKANGIIGYLGTAKQNMKLLNLLKQGKLKAVN